MTFLLALALWLFRMTGFLTEPMLTFRLATGSDIAPLVIFNLCALVSGVSCASAGAATDMEPASARIEVAARSAVNRIAIVHPP